MAVIKPFRGVRYNPARFSDMHTVVSQPYDRIDHDLLQEYLALSPYNIVHIIQGHIDEDTPQESDPEAVYARAREYYQQWLAEGILIQEDRPALYVYEQQFTVNGQPYTRLGMIAAVELVDFDKGIILPHERTHRGPKVDRYHLMKTLKVNPEQIFLLYPDVENRVNALLRQATANRPPDIDVVELFEQDVRQRVWRITDPAIIQAIEAIIEPMRHLIIADGHHRYETALHYRNEQRKLNPDMPPNAAANYITATLVSMNDPGLVVLPTHREIHHFTDTAPAVILERAAPDFHIAPAANLDNCLAAVNAHPTGHAFGFYGGRDVGFHVLTLKDEALIDHLITDDHSRTWKSLPVSIVHKILLEQIAGVPAQGIEDKTLIRYHRDARAAVENIDHGDGNFAFFVSPTRMEDIQACVANGEQMPQKSTDFYPKMISGLVLFPLTGEVGSPQMESPHGELIAG